MGGTILPPTQREIESENRQLKTENHELKNLLGDFVRAFQDESDSAFCRVYFIKANEMLSQKTKPKSQSELNAWKSCLKYAPK